MIKQLYAFILWAIFLLPTASAVLLMPLRILFADIEQVKELLRAQDQMTNAFWLNGHARETVSSHAWRVPQLWADFVIWFTDLFEKGHCMKANKSEQPVIDFIERKG